MSQHKQHESPQRSCLGCRESRDKGLLIRFVLSPQSEVVPDLDAKLPGRGAYTCNSRECLLAACRQRQFNRTFKREVVSLPEEIIHTVSRVMKDRILNLLGLANKAGKIVSGGSLVSDAVRSAHKPAFVLVATDVSEAIGEKIEKLSEVHGVPCMRLMTKETYGDILGKAPRSAVGIKTGVFDRQLATAIKRYRNFLGEVRFNE